MTDLTDLTDLGARAPAATVWLTGLPAAGKTTVGTALVRRLRQAGAATSLLDGDVLRTGLNRDLGYSRADRDENVRRVGEVAALLAAAGVVAVVPVVSPYRAARRQARAVHEARGLRFVEVHVATPLGVCAARDPKGLYARQARGELTGLTGVDDPYEPPEHADVVLDDVGVDASVDLVLAALGHDLIAAARA